MTANRRQFLTNVSLGAGATVLSPMLARLHAEAGGAAPAKRVVFVVEGNGVPWHQIQPKGIERNKNLIASGTYTGRSGGVREGVCDVPLKDHDLPAALDPVSFVKDRVTVLQGLSGKMCGGGHSSDFGALGAFTSKGPPAGPTIDCALGKHLGGVFPHVGLGMTERPGDTVVYNCSAVAAGTAAPTQTNPALAYQALFGSAAGGAAKKAFDSRKPLLDHLAADVKRAEASLAGPEREKLQGYLRAFETMRDRHGKLVEMEATLKKNAPPVTDKFTSAVETDRLDAQFSLAGAALVSGLTNAVTIASGAGNPYFSVRFKGLGITLDKHSIGHGGGFEGKTADELSTTIRRFHFELIARLVKTLQGVKEGNGTMFDNTLIVYLSDGAEGHHSRCWEWPAVLIGNLGGALKTGRYLELPGHGAKGHKHIGNLYTTFLNAAGDQRETFGQPDQILGGDVDQKGGVAELLA
ncbi:Uncharacterized protein OS=Pirellula staleyi (strain ATCC 27377 / DSM 6068 / ICPB 4128) GN=Psta_0305 PE=4 SV=1: HXXSHH [Gemmataceae bacterium]|nr:Uncharacterized protein OS=Pirellula staleyi (strain ATCC 27377 / DSM 6068 / ICPB 4128) GN=Psta_0305 PE=4 SV=1: HXXSHH [Gemmataceae bacterium]VTU02060.1 Uncharacterized protein OS=Pirellula staleyi (strain ATCC 27377 / DSM 6068 / ICPB 4128) GN=Psta_0305 PE=4 SV=1: HXXSHH [Gemmataceae bacterium]